MNSETTPRDVFALVTNRIIIHLEKGSVPWKKPWTDRGLPYNLFSGKPYRGVNVWLLNSLNYEQNAFLTFNQVQELGGKVRSGERSHVVVLWKLVDDISAQNKKIPFLRYYRVFNIAQCSDINEWYLPAPTLIKNDPLELCEAIVETMPHAPDIRHLGTEAYYHPFFDVVNMPSMHSFISSETYYATLFNELIHSTGHISRLNRKELREAVTPNKIDQHSLEELTAEIGACYLNSFAGIDGWDFQNHIAYIQNWLNGSAMTNGSLCMPARRHKGLLHLKGSNTEERANEEAVLETILV